MYEDAVDQLGTARMWQMYVESLLELHSNDVIRPKIRLRLYGVCQRALTARKLTDKHILDWVMIFWSREDWSLLN